MALPLIICVSLDKLQSNPVPHCSALTEEDKKNICSVRIKQVLAPIIIILLLYVLAHSTLQRKGTTGGTRFYLLDKLAIVDFI